MTRDEEHYLIAVRAELPVAILGGCISVAGLVFPRWIGLTNLLLLLIVLLYDIVFKGHYTAVTKNLLTIIVFLLTCLAQPLWYFYPQGFIVFPIFDAPIFFLQLFPALLFWSGFVFTFMLRQGMSATIPAVFTALIQLVLLWSYTGFSYIYIPNFYHSFFILLSSFILRGRGKPLSYIVLLPIAIPIVLFILLLIVFFFLFLNSPLDFRFG